MNWLSRFADRLAHHLASPPAHVYELDCPYCDTTHDIPCRQVKVYVTAYLRESFAAARCPNYETLDITERLMNEGAKFRVFHELPPISEDYVDRFVSSLDRTDVIELAKEHP